MTKGASRQSRFLSPAWLMFGSALLCVVLVPVVHAAMHYSSEKSARYDQLAEMTKSERLKVEHSFAEFQQLSPEQQQSFRELDRRLNNEDINLKTALADYQEFLTSLSPVERAELDRATTKRARLNAIERIQDERAILQQQLDMGYSMMEQYRSDSSRQRGEVFTPEEIKAFTELIEPRLPTDAREKAKLDSQVGTVRFALTMAAALDAWGARTADHKQEVFEKDLMAELLAAIQNERVRESFDRLPREELRPFKFIDYSFRTVMREQFKSTPDTSVLYQFLEGRDSKEKEELMSKEPKWMYYELAKRYAEKNPTDLSRAVDQMKKEAGPFFERMRNRSGRGPSGRSFDRDGEKPSRGPQGKFNGPRRPGDDRPPGDRVGTGPRPSAETAAPGSE